MSMVGSEIVDFATLNSCSRGRMRGYSVKAVRLMGPKQMQVVNMDSFSFRRGWASAVSKGHVMIRKGEGIRPFKFLNTGE
jgi:hypothetical protein